MLAGEAGIAAVLSDRWPQKSFCTLPYLQVYHDKTPSCAVYNPSTGNFLFSLRRVHLPHRMTRPEWHVWSCSEPGSLCSLGKGRASVSQSFPYAGSYVSCHSVGLVPIQSLRSKEQEKRHSPHSCLGFKWSVWFEIWIRSLMI